MGWSWDCSRTGERYGRLIVIAELRLAPVPGEAPWTHRGVAALCDCGTEVVRRLIDVTSGKTRSCGCLQSENSRELMTSLRSR